MYALAGLGRVGERDAMGEEQVGDAVAVDVFHHIAGEVAEVDDMDLLERVEQVAGKGITVAVFDDEQPAAVLGRCHYLGGVGVSAHEGAVGGVAAIFVFPEEVMNQKQ